jgi:hypothetical protein
MTQTPPEALNKCRQNSLLRDACPRRMPTGTRGSAPGRQEYYCSTGDPHETASQTIVLFASPRCVQAEWGYELVTALPGRTSGTRLSAWDGKEWVAEGYAPLTPPPWHVHIDIEASKASVRTTGGFGWPTGAHPVSDTLLNPTRDQAVSLGWVHWYGHYGQLVIAPTNVAGGLWAGHVIFAYIADGIHYYVTLHAWASKERIIGRGVERVLNFQAGQALPHVIATLQAVVASETSSVHGPESAETARRRAAHPRQ